jgi:hypothetical protein
LADLRAHGASACWIFLNPPTSTPRTTRERTMEALHALDRRARPPRSRDADVEAERVLAAVVAAERAAAWIHVLAASSSCALDRDVILAPAYDLAAVAADVRASLAPDSAPLAAAAAEAAAAYALAAAAARRAAGL